MASLEEIYHTLGRLESKVDDMKDDMVQHLKDDKGVHESIRDILRNQDRRIDKVERKQSWMMGVAAGVGAFGAAAWEAIKHFKIT